VAQRSDDVRPGSRSEIRSPSWPVTRASRRRKLRHRFHGAFRVVHRGRIHLCVCAAVTTLSGPFPPERRLARSRRIVDALSIITAAHHHHPPLPLPSPRRLPIRRRPRVVRLAVSNIDVFRPVIFGVIISRGRHDVALRDIHIARCVAPRRVASHRAESTAHLSVLPMTSKKTLSKLPSPSPETAHCVFKMSARSYRRCVVIVVVVVVASKQTTSDRA